MKFKIALSAALLTGAIAMPVQAAETIEVAYPYSALFDVTFDRIMPMFNKMHPDITVKFRATYDNYEDATQTILREAVTGKQPDISLQGLNRQAMLVEKGIAKSLEPYIAGEADFSKDGYHQAMLDLSTFNGVVYALPFSVSLPVGYYNMTNFEKAGITGFPNTWDDVVTNCEKLQASELPKLLF